MHFNGFGTHVSLIEYGLSIGNLLLIYFLVAACFVDWLTGTKVLGDAGSTSRASPPVAWGSSNGS